MPTLELDFPFAGGIDEKTQSQLVEPGAALVVNNLRQIKSGSYEKRLGNSAFATPVDMAGASIPTQKRLIGYKDGVCTTDHLNLYTRLPHIGIHWRKASGYAPQLDIKSSSVSPVQYELKAHHTASVNGYNVVAYSMATDRTGTSFAIFASVSDAHGNVILPAVNVTAGVANTMQFSMTTAGNTVVIVYGLTSGADILAYTLDTTSLSTVAAGWSTSTTIVNNMCTGTVAIDTCSLGSTFILAYVDSSANGAAVNQLTVKSFNSALALQATNTTIDTGGAAGSMSCVSVSGNSANTLFVAFSRDTKTTLECVALNPSTLVLTGTKATLSSIHSAIYSCTVLWTGTNEGIAMYNDALVYTGGGARKFTLAGGAIVPTSATDYLFHGVYNETKLFTANGRTYCCMRPVAQVSADIPDNHQLLLIDMTATMTDSAANSDLGYMRVAGNIHPRLTEPTGFGIGANRNPSSVITVSSTSTVIPTVTKKNNVGGSMDLVHLNWAATTMNKTAVLGEDVALSGSPPSVYDGVRVNEIGFFQAPRIVSSSFSGVDGPDGVYKYAVIFEQTDNKSQWHQSNVSLPFDVDTGPGPQGVEIVCRTLQCSNRAEYNNVFNSGSSAQWVRAHLYRTVADGNEYFSTGITALVNPSNTSVTFALDTLSDAVMVEGAFPMYTQPGTPNVAQPKVTPPCFTDSFTHGNRLIGLNDSSVWFSGEYVLGDGYWFADAFQFEVTGGEGDLTAGASMDGAMVLFKRNAIAFVDGSGPPDNGAGGDFSPPQFITADVGCIEPRSIVLTPAGLMFQSLRGIEMLSRGRSLLPYFGAHVKNTLAANPVITSACLDEAKGCVVLTCLPSESASTGVEIVWDYIHNIWLTDTVSAGIAIKSATMSNTLSGHVAGTLPVRTWLNYLGVTSQETPADYSDTTGYVAGTITTPWIKMSGLQGYGRTCGMALLLENTTPSDILVSIRLDYKSAVVQTRLFTAAEIATITDPSDLYVTFKVQKCSAFQATLTDATPTGGPAVGTGQGPKWVGLRIEYQQKKGTKPTSRATGA